MSNNSIYKNTEQNRSELSKFSELTEILKLETFIISKKDSTSYTKYIILNRDDESFYIYEIALVPRYLTYASRSVGFEEVDRDIKDVEEYAISERFVKNWFIHGRFQDEDNYKQAWNIKELLQSFSAREFKELKDYFERYFTPKRKPVLRTKKLEDIMPF